MSENGTNHYFGGGYVGIGLNEFTPTARFQVSVNGGGGSEVDVAKFEINNCGAACGQGTARNIVLANANGTNAKFATIVFAPSTVNTTSGSEIAGVERSEANLSSGISFSTRDNVAGATLNERFRISANGHIGIGHQNPAYDLHLGNGAYVSNAGVWTNASDARLKTNIVATTYGLKEVMALRPVHYNMKKGGEAQEGFIAQEVRKVIPEVVSGKEGDLLKGETLGLSYGNLVPVLTKAIQEQQARIEALEAEKATYKAFMQEMKTEITSLKEQFGIKSEENQKSKK